MHNLRLIKTQTTVGPLTASQPRVKEETQEKVAENGILDIFTGQAQTGENATQGRQNDVEDPKKKTRTSSTDIYSTFLMIHSK